MTASKDSSPCVASEASDASMLHTSAVGAADGLKPPDGEPDMVPQTCGKRHSAELSIPRGLSVDEPRSVSARRYRSEAVEFSEVLNFFPFFAEPCWYANYWYDENEKSGVVRRLWILIFHSGMRQLHLAGLTHVGSFVFHKLKRVSPPSLINPG